MSTAIVVALIVLALVAVAVSTATSLAATRSPASGRRDGAGAPVRLICPRTYEPTTVRIGADPVDRNLAVVWCQHFPTGAIECARECFTSIRGVGGPEALVAPA